MAPRGAPQRVECPERICGAVFTGISAAISHFVFIHAGVCPVCAQDEDDLEDDHIAACTVRIRVGCDTCGEDYEVADARQHYQKHDQVRIKALRFRQSPQEHVIHFDRTRLS